MIDKICVVTVTYSDRFHFLKQSIDACLDEGVDKIIVVDNASTENSRKELQDYERKSKGKLKVIYLDENTGSAGGYKRGLEEVYKSDNCEFIWLLDDDNVPLQGTLKQLIQGYNTIMKTEKLSTNQLAVSCFRPELDNYVKLVLRGKKNIADKIYLRKNTFKGFHFANFFTQIFKITNFEVNSKKNMFNPEKSIFKGNIEIPFSVYSGLFFSKALIHKIGFPDDSFFLYSDDWDYTLKITKNSGKIYIVPKAILKDLELSFNTNSFAILSLSYYKLYYKIRNAIILEKRHFIDNAFIYNINKFLFKLLVKIMYIVGYIKKERYQIIMLAIKDGENDIMGETF